MENEFDESPIQENEEYIQEPAQVIKPKKKLSEKQIEALRLGRELGQKKLQEINKAKNNMLLKRVKAVAYNAHRHEDKYPKDQPEYIEEEEEKQTPPPARTNVIRKETNRDDFDTKINSIMERFEKMDSTFTNYINDKQTRRKEKDMMNMEKTIQQELPKAVNKMYLQQNIQRELQNNPFLGKV